jgi:hypothetical protein
MAKTKTNPQKINDAGRRPASSVNSLGNSPDSEFAGEVYSQDAARAKKSNTKR